MAMFYLSAAILVVLLILAGFLVHWLFKLNAIRLPRPWRPGGVKAERFKLKADIDAAKVNGLALFLIASIGITQFGLETWRIYSSDRQSAPANLEELLHSRLPDTETQRQWHGEIIDEIRRIAQRQETDDLIRSKLIDLQSRLDRHEKAISSLQPGGSGTSVEVDPALLTFFHWLMRILGAAILLWTLLYVLYISGWITLESRKAWQA